MVAKHRSDSDAVNGDHDYGVLHPKTTVLFQTLPATNRDKHFLVPGGRYLVTATPESLQLWDLGVAGYFSSISPRVLSRVTLKLESAVEPEGERELNNITDLVVQQVQGGQLRIAILAMDGDILLAHVFDITPADENPAFVQLALLQIHVAVQMPWDLLINENHLGMRLDDNYLILWDFIAGAYLLWDIYAFGEQRHGHLGPRVTVIDAADGSTPNLSQDHSLGSFELQAHAG
ncbi:hypothetical protein EST38_g5630 [Candolleomyces aberdarensis]|uniref:Uncharacterized protein n=1 Tax=Candolleomyces aberdarensis TaxID=2316362 RepID=A0A4Q2DMP3_9AGAR|nr:hypothetical protein EST38_g5630 [Candolleomyces aberdarensis]